VVADVSKGRVALRYLHGPVTFEDEGDTTNDRPSICDNYRTFTWFSSLDMDVAACILVSVKLRSGIENS
jgi:hypothetical protein